MNTHSDSINKRIILLFLIFCSVNFFSCSSDDNDCPDTITIVSQEDLELAERCGLAPAEPLGDVWVSKGYDPDEE